MFDFLQAEKYLEAADDDAADIIAPISNEEQVGPVNATGFNQNCSQSFQANLLTHRSNRGSGFHGGSGRANSNRCFYTNGQAYSNAPQNYNNGANQNSGQQNSGQITGQNLGQQNQNSYY